MVQGSAHKGIPCASGVRHLYRITGNRSTGRRREGHSAVPAHGVQEQAAAHGKQLLCSGCPTAALPRQRPLFLGQSLKIFSCAQTRRHKAFSFHQLQKSQAYREAQILI